MLPKPEFSSYSGEATVSQTNGKPFFVRKMPRQPAPTITESLSTHEKALSQVKPDVCLLPKQCCNLKGCTNPSMLTRNRKTRSCKKKMVVENSTPQ